MPSHVEFVPMDWGPKYHNLWQHRKKYIHKHNSKHILAFNEPDVKGQANMSPKAAASRFMKELEPYRKKGIKVSSPQIVWNTKWMASFLKHLRARGGDVDFIAIHYYGSWKDLGRFKKFVKTVHNKFGKDIWVTEYGVTASSGGSSAQIKGFQTKATKWMEKRSYVKRVAWLGCFAINSPPDSFASRRNAMFASGGKLRSIAYSFIYGSGKHTHTHTGKRDVTDEAAAGTGALEARSTPGARRHAMQHHRRIINSLQRAADLIRRNDTEETGINGYEATPEDIEDYLKNANVSDEDDDDDTPQHDGELTDCDEICQLRDGETADTTLDEEDEDDPEDD